VLVLSGAAEVALDLVRAGARRALAVRPDPARPDPAARRAA
jgi:hypothetical protein